MDLINTTSKKMMITGRVCSILAILFLLLDGIGKIAKPVPVLKATVQLGYPDTLVSSIGILLVVCTLIYAIPKFSFIGAVLLTAFLGGAVAVQLRVENPLFSHTLFPVYIGILIWGGLLLRNAQLRQMFTNKATGL